jgi:hypothetical protein
MEDEEKKKTKHIKDNTWKGVVKGYRTEEGKKWFAIFTDKKGWEKRIPIQPHPPLRYMFPVRKDITVIELREKGSYDTTFRQTHSIEFERYTKQENDKFIYVYYREV